MHIQAVNWAKQYPTAPSDRHPGRPAGTSSSPISTEQAQDLLTLYRRVSDAGDPVFMKGNSVEAENAKATREQYFAEIERIIVDSGYIDHVFDTVVKSIAKRFNTMNKQYETELNRDVYPEYSDRVHRLLRQNDFVLQIIRSLSNPSKQNRIVADTAVVRQALWVAFRNVLLKVVDEHAMAMGLPRMWKTQWSVHTNSLDEMTSSGDEATAIGENIADTAPESQPETAHGDVERGIQANYPEISEFIPSIVAEALAEIPEGGATTPEAANTAAQAAINKHVKERTEIYMSVLKAAGGDADELEDIKTRFPDVDYYQDPEYLQGLTKAVAEGIVAAQAGYQKYLGGE